MGISRGLRLPSGRKRAGVIWGIRVWNSDALTEAGEGVAEGVILL